MNAKKTYNRIYLHISNNVSITILTKQVKIQHLTFPTRDKKFPSNLAA